MKWRMLEAGEQAQKGDQFYNGQIYGWLDILDRALGYVVRLEDLGRFRRAA